MIREIWRHDHSTGWRVSSLKRLGFLKGGAGFPIEEQGLSGLELPFYKVKDLRETDFSLSKTEHCVSREIALKLGAYIFPPSTLVFAKVGEAVRLNRYKLLSMYSCIDNNMMGYVFEQNTLSPKYVYYLANQIFDISYIANPGPIPSVGSRQIGYFDLCIPDIQEQRLVTAYLDKACAAIDKAIEAKQKQLEILDALRKSIIHKAVTRGLDDSVELKDSGVEWLGRIPSTWHSQRIKDVAKLSPGFSVGKPTMTDLCTVIPMEAVSESGEISTDQVQEFNSISGGLTNFEVGDIIFAKITPCMENGKGAYIIALPTKYAFGSTEFHVLRPSDKVDGKFLYYYTFNSVYRKYAEKNMTGAAGQKRVSTNFIKYTRIYLPDVMEQHHIAEYLDKKCSELAELQENIKQQISTLEQYRKSLIYECVTGKRRITDNDMQDQL